MKNLGEILIPSRTNGPRPWKITAPWLKLSLKYGLKGPWEAPNKSVAFDHHSQSRGPKSGSPTIGDFAVTSLMNSNVTGDDLARASDWLKLDENALAVDTAVNLLNQCGGLAQMPDPTRALLGSVMDRIEELPGIKTAKVAKWFSAWAPAHVPMIDQYVAQALLGPNEKLWAIGWADLLERYREILIANLGTLESLGAILAKAISLASPITPVRILDSLIWFDWWACYEYPHDFSAWVKPDDQAGQHAISDKGLEYEATFQG